MRSRHVFQLLISMSRDNLEPLRQSLWGNVGLKNVTRTAPVAPFRLMCISLPPELRSGQSKECMR